MTQVRSLPTSRAICLLFLKILSYLEMHSIKKDKSKYSTNVELLSRFKLGSYLGVSQLTIPQQILDILVHHALVHIALRTMRCCKLKGMLIKNLAPGVER